MENNQGILEKNLTKMENHQNVRERKNVKRKKRERTLSQETEIAQTSGKRSTAPESENPPTSRKCSPANLPKETEIGSTSGKRSPVQEIEIAPASRKRSGATFWLTRIVSLRSLAAIYFVAFVIAFNQGSLFFNFGLSSGQLTEKSGASFTKLTCIFDSSFGIFF
jgi:hypothetical protein